MRDFNFKIQGYGAYLVEYISPKTGKVWSKRITDMQVIDATKNAEYPKIKDIEQLKRMVKS
jgi:hypothetical protein